MLEEIYCEFIVDKADWYDIYRYYYWVIYEGYWVANKLIHSTLVFKQILIYINQYLNFDFNKIEASWYYLNYNFSS